MSSLMEMRTQFAPYSNSARSRQHGNPLRPPRPKPPVDLNIFCLGGPRDDVVPTTERRRELVMNDLGASMISIGSNFELQPSIVGILINIGVYDF